MCDYENGFFELHYTVASSLSIPLPWAVLDMNLHHDSGLLALLSITAVLPIIVLTMTALSVVAVAQRRHKTGMHMHIAANSYKQTTKGWLHINVFQEFCRAYRFSKVLISCSWYSHMYVCMYA